MTEPLSGDELAKLDAHWRAANYLAVGQIHLLGNPLLREPLRPEHVKPGLLGDWASNDRRSDPVEHQQYIVQRGEDLPEVRDWRWTP